MSSCALIIRTCRHTLHGGRRCLQPAVRGRTRCRHHLDAQARLHNMARARRRSLILRFRVPVTLHDLACNNLEVNRILATERLDPDTVRMMLWAMDLSASALHAGIALRRRTQNGGNNSNKIYDVPISHSFPQSSGQNPSQPSENT